MTKTTRQRPRPLDLAELYVSMRRGLTYQLRSAGVPDDEIEDLYQDIFMYAAQWADSYDPDRDGAVTPETWIYHWVTRTALSRRYGKKSARRKMEMLEDSYDEIASHVLDGCDPHEAGIAGVTDAEHAVEREVQAKGFEDALARELDDHQWHVWRRLEGDLTSVPTFAASELCSDLDLTRTQLERVLNRLRKTVRDVFEAHFDPAEHARPLQMLGSVVTPAARSVDEPERDDPAPIRMPAAISLTPSVEFWADRVQGSLWSEGEVPDGKLLTLPSRPRKARRPRISEHMRPVQLQLLAA